MLPDDGTEDNKVGMVTTRKGAALSAGEIAGSVVDGHNMFPTANVVLNWSTGKTEAHQLDKNLSTITVRSAVYRQLLPQRRAGFGHHRFSQEPFDAPGRSPPGDIRGAHRIQRRCR
jgi:hypothetical protein